MIRPHSGKKTMPMHSNQAKIGCVRLCKQMGERPVRKLFLCLTATTDTNCSYSFLILEIAVHAIYSFLTRASPTRNATEIIHVIKQITQRTQGGEGNGSKHDGTANPESKNQIQKCLKESCFFIHASFNCGLPVASIINQSSMAKATMYTAYNKNHRGEKSRVIFSCELFVVLKAKTNISLVSTSIQTYQY